MQQLLKASTSFLYLLGKEVWTCHNFLLMKTKVPTMDVVTLVIDGKTTEIVATFATGGKMTETDTTPATTGMMIVTDTTLATTGR